MKLGGYKPTGVPSMHFWLRTRKSVLNLDSALLEESTPPLEGFQAGHGNVSNAKEWGPVRQRPDAEGWPWIRFHFSSLTLQQ